MIRASGFSLALAAVLAVALPARADDDPRKAAGAHYQKGLELANRAEYRAALDEFNAAYAASPNYAVLYNIGQAQVAIGRPRLAIDALTRYLNEGAEQIPPVRRQQVEGQLGALKSAFGYLRVTTEPEGALVTVDGAELGRTPFVEPLRLNPGSHIVTLSLQNKGAETRQITLAEGQEQALKVQLFEAPMAPAALPTPAPVETPPPAPPEPPPPVSAPDKTGLPFGYLLMGAGVAVGGVTLAHYFWNEGRVREFRHNQTELRSNAVDDRHQRQVENNDLADSIDRASVVTALLGVGAGALVAGGAVTLTWSGTW